MTAPIAPSTRTEIDRVFALQRANRTALKRRGPDERRATLSRLREALIARTDEIDATLNADLRKPRMGARNNELMSVIEEIDTALAELPDWMAPTPVEPSPRFAGNTAYVMHEPRGVCLLFGAWNFPFSLTLAPLIPILAAGNSAIVKPNELQPRVSALVADIIRTVFDPSEVAVFEGGVDLAEALLELPVDHIFFTGSPAVGKRVMAAASRHLASVTLELGGKCPAILGPGCDLTDAAAKAVAARFNNAGQLCLAVDHVWVPRAQVPAFLAIASAVIDKMFYVDGALQTDRFARIVDARNLARLRSTIDDAVARGATVARGGEAVEADLTLHPTLLTDVPLDARIMTEEIFGPVLPVLAYDDLDTVLEQIDRTGKPLALYVFSGDDGFIDRVLTETSSGGVTVNGVLMHYMESRLPFGGVNGSGMGRYKGIHGFRELSNPRAVFVQVPPPKTA